MSSDRDYRSFVTSLPRSSKSDRLPVSKWVTQPALWGAAPVTTWVAQLSGGAKLRIHEVLSIVAVTVQPPVVRITGLPTATTFATTTSTSTSTSTTTTTLQLPPLESTSVLPPTHQVSVVLVVANAGNAQISGVWAAASVVAESAVSRNPGSSSPIHSTAVGIGGLAPGSSVEVTLRPLAVAAGDSYELWVSVGTGQLPARPVTSPSKGVGQTDEVRIRVASE